jgi:ribose transport system permease protein
MTLAVEKSTRARVFLRRLALQREVSLLATVVVLIVAMSLASPYFFTLANLRAVSVGLVPTGIIVVGMTFLLVSGGFDLSVGSVLALSSTLCALMMMHGAPILVAVVGAIIAGLLIGIVNGLLVAGLSINPLVATLGAMSAARGLALVLTEGFSLSSLPPSFGLAGNMPILGLPIVVWIMLAIVIVGDALMRRATLFRALYLMGSNEKAARLSGLDVGRMRIFAYAICSTLAALAGVLLASRLMSGTPTAGAGLELQVLAAAVIGGASLRGGEGTVLGAFLGAVFVALINNAMTMLAVSIYWQMLVTGVVLVLAVAIDMTTRRRSYAS